jgi:hypothetical protein
MNSDKELYKIWKKYIDVPIYRVVTERDFHIMLKKGLDPKKDPYERIKPKLKKFLKLVKDLEKKGFVMKFQWGGITVTGKYAADITLDDITMPCIDFTPNKKGIKYHIKLGKGGATVANILGMAERIIKEKPKITKENWKLVKDLNKWAKKNLFNKKAIYVLGSSKVFESSLFQYRKKDNKKTRSISYRRKRNYYKSIFGSFEYFKKIIRKEGLKKYMPYLKSQRFFIRVKNKIPAKEIKELK